MQRSQRRTGPSTADYTIKRRLPIGAEVMRDGGTHFRVWAPKASGIDLVIVTDDSCVRERFALPAEERGYFAGYVAAAKAGTLYAFQLNGDETRYPDPVSRFQPFGPHGPSQVVDPAHYKWSDANWRGIGIRGQILYELHVGTFTPTGTWQAAIEHLEHLKEVGITVVEVMPVAEFPGRFGWGYDGVNLYAPTRLYGTPDDFRRFVDRAHALGLGVILDVVYNHLGPDGNYLATFSDAYLSTTHRTDWGAAVNFDGPGCRPVREFYTANAVYWISEFHLDGLRLDATQDIHDSSHPHILSTISRAARKAAEPRRIIIVAENEPQAARLVRPIDREGYDLDAMWNDDFHHSAIVRLTGHNEAYYSDYYGSSQEFVSAARHGFLYQGQWYTWQKQPRGTPALDLPPHAFIHFIQNHDQVANTALGERVHARTSPGRYKAMTALLLLEPQTPMLFQGQEFAASARFFYFADHKRDLAELVNKGRREFMAQFPSLSRPEMQSRLPDPADPQTYARSKIDWADRDRHHHILAVHVDLLRLRREDPVFAAQRSGGVDGAVLSADAFVLRFFGDHGDDRLLLINFAADLWLGPMPEPLLAPPANHTWRLIWSSEDVQYGGAGTPPLHKDGLWLVPGEAAVVFRSEVVVPGPKMEDTPHVEQLDPSQTHS